MEKLTRNCPICQKERIYKNVRAFNDAIIQNKICQSCAAKKDYEKRKLEGKIIKKKKEKKIVTSEIFIRNCPSCSKEIFYKKLKNLQLADEKNSKCKSCTMKEINYKRDRTGKNNPMYGKTIYDIWVEKYGKEEADNRQIEYIKKQSFSSKNKLNLDFLVKKHGKEKGEKIFKNQLRQVKEWNKKGRSKTNYEHWLEKYGKEEADKRKKNEVNRKSESMTGKNNPMYGKPSPQGSGNGWKGWYKGIYFTSLREFYYLKYLIDNNIEFENGEQRKYKVSYEFMGKNLNYFIDFYLPKTDEYIEIKPNKLVNSPRNLAKFNAAKEKYGEKFKVITEKDLNKVDLDILYKLYLNKEIVFLKKYEEKFIEYYKKHKGDQ